MAELHSPNKTPTEDEFQYPLRSSPSFEIYNNINNDPEQVLKRTVMSLESIGSSSDFTFERSKMDLIQEEENENDWSTEIQNLGVDDDDDVQPSTPPMYLATGLGVDAGDVVSDNNLIISDDMFVPNLQESENLEEYYKRMVHDYPSHPLILKKYALFLQVSCSFFFRDFVSYFFSMKHGHSSD